MNLWVRSMKPFSNLKRRNSRPQLRTVLSQPWIRTPFKSCFRRTTTRRTQRVGSLKNRMIAVWYRPKWIRLIWRRFRRKWSSILRWIMGSTLQKSKIISDSCLDLLQNCHIVLNLCAICLKEPYCTLERYVMWIEWPRRRTCTRGSCSCRCGVRTPATSHTWPSPNHDIKRMPYSSNAITNYKTTRMRSRAYLMTLSYFYKVIRNRSIFWRLPPTMTLAAWK